MLHRLLAEWHSDNESPHKVARGSKQKRKWKCPRCERIYEASPCNRTSNGSNCPGCGNVRKGRRWGLLQDLRPDLAAEFDESVNRVSLSSISLGSYQKVAWVCNTCGHRWTTRVSNRTTAGSDCPGPCRRERRLRKIGTVQRFPE